MLTDKKLKHVLKRRDNRLIFLKGNMNYQNNIPNEMFGDLCQMIYTQNCFLIRKICNEYNWDSERMINDLLSNQNELPEECFDAIEENIVAKELSHEEMTNQFTSGLTRPILMDMIGGRETLQKIEGLITLDNTIVIKGKKFDINRMGDISGIIVLWKGHVSLWDITEGKIYNIVDGELVYIEDCNKTPEEMTSYYIDL